jgi:putative cardiolipin synthase
MRYQFTDNIYSVSRHRSLIQSGLCLVFLWLSFIAVVLLACTTLPKPEIKSLTLAYEPHPERRLAAVTRDLLKGMGPETSGFFMLLRNDEALRWRLLLADLAEETLDIQVFIWKDDVSSALLLERAIKAADRGVRVRILVDDIHLIGGDRAVAALNQHRQIEVRIFNPAKGRSGSSVLYGIEFLGNVKQLNQRMHNKLMVADNRFCIVGGRNIGNEYFGLNHKHNFIDFDVLGVGPIAPEVSSSFDLYWNSREAYPGEALLKNLKDQDLLTELREEIRQILVKNENLLVEFQQQHQDWDNYLEELARNMFTGTARVIYDEPLVGEDTPPVQLIESLDELTLDAQQEVLVSTPYFIPDDEFYKTVPALISRGVRAVVLTNSLGSTNHPIVHSAYKKHRKKVIELGVQLFEMRYDAAAREEYDTPPVESRALGLHAKVIIVDRGYTYVGSLNLDPRSIYLNTEFGLIIDSPDFAQAIAHEFELALEPENSWQVLLDDKDRLFWKSGEMVIRKEPARTFWQRFQSAFFGLFSLDDQL